MFIRFKHFNFTRKSLFFLCVVVFLRRTRHKIIFACYIISISEKCLIEYSFRKRSWSSFVRLLPQFQNANETSAIIKGQLCGKFCDIYSKPVFYSDHKNVERREIFLSRPTISKTRRERGKLWTTRVGEMERTLIKKQRQFLACSPCNFVRTFI